jgi:hypothetical protein
MPTSLSPVSLANVALSKIGAQAINSFTDLSNPSSIAVNNNWVLAYLEVSRAARWNCLVTPAVLVQIPQVPIPDGVVPSVVPDWAPLTSYAADTYLTYGGYLYITAFAYTSTANFTIDLTTGALLQTNLPFPGLTFPTGDGSQYPSGWAFQYALPSDFQLLVALNDNTGWWGWFGSQCSSEYEIMGDKLYTNAQQAVVKYVKNQPDVSQFDSMFANALTLKLASAISTTLRQDGGKMEVALLQGYQQALKEARTKNAGERKGVRFNPIGSSDYNRARYGGING